MSSLRRHGERSTSFELTVSGGISISLAFHNDILSVRTALGVFIGSAFEQFSFGPFTFNLSVGDLTAFISTVVFIIIGLADSVFIDISDHDSVIVTHLFTGDLGALGVEFLVTDGSPFTLKGFESSFSGGGDSVDFVH